MPLLMKQALGQGSGDLPVSFFLPQTQHATPLPLGTGVMSAAEGQREKVCYARCESAQKMLLGSYEMEIHFSGHFILMTVLIIVFFFK